MVLDEFLPYVGREFLADGAPATVALTLVEAKSLPDTGVADRPPFNLLFRSTPDILLVSGIYALQTGGFGPNAVYISPIIAPPRSEPGYYYQAVFN